METAEMDKILRDIELQQKPGCYAKNLQNVLDALWKITDKWKHIAKPTFKSHLKRLNPYIMELYEQECIDYKYSINRDAKKIIELITLINKNIYPTTLHNENTPTSKFPPHCLVFIDMPNICNYNGYMDFLRSDWEMLRQVIVNITNVPLKDQSCYVYNVVRETDSDKFNEKYKELRLSDVNVKLRSKKDIDAMLITDMLFQSIPYMQKDREVHLVIVSGDGDYAYPIQKLREVAQSLVSKLNVSVLTWRHKTSFELLDVTDQMHYLEDHLSKIDRVGENQRLRDSIRW